MRGFWYIVQTDILKLLSKGLENRYSIKGLDLEMELPIPDPFPTTPPPCVTRMFKLFSGKKAIKKQDSTNLRDCVIINVSFHLYFELKWA